MAQDFSALTMAHKFMREHINLGDLCIDATTGRGRDTVLLRELVGSKGQVLAFDIQQEALDSARNLLETQGIGNRVQLILDSHSNMAQYALPDTVDYVAFNLGWLPSGDHSVFTSATTSIPAIEAALSLLKVGGVMSICIYYGKDSGFEERDSLLAYLPSIDPARFTVLISQFCNRPNNPPIPVFVYKER